MPYHDFNRFITGCLKEFPGHYSKCIDQYFNDVFVIKMETLPFDLSKVLSEIGIKHDPQKIINAPKYGERNKPFQWNVSQRAQIVRNEWSVIEKYYL